MNVKDNIEWLKSLKQQIGQTQHCDLWHFEQAIDETIDSLRPLTEPHGRLIDADELKKNMSCGKRWERILKLLLFVLGVLIPLIVTIVRLVGYLISMF